MLNKELKIDNVALKQKSAKTIWGKVVLYLKENKHIMLHMACGDIVDVEIKEDQFVINTDELLLYDILTDEKNKTLLKQALTQQALKLDIVINRIFKQSELIQQDIDKLKNLGINLKIVEGDNYE